MGRVHAYVSSLLYIGDMLNCNISPKDGNMIKKKESQSLKWITGWNSPSLEYPFGEK